MEPRQGPISTSRFAIIEVEENDDPEVEDEDRHSRETREEEYNALEALENTCRMLITMPYMHCVTWESAGIA